MLRFEFHSGVLSVKKNVFLLWFSFWENYWFPHCLLTTGSTVLLFPWTRCLLLPSVTQQVLNSSLLLHPNSKKFIHLSQSSWKSVLPQMLIKSSGIPDTRESHYFGINYFTCSISRAKVRAGTSFSDLLLLQALSYVSLSLTRFQLLCNLVVSQTF